MLESEYGQGACFTFVIDLEERNDEESGIRRLLNPISRIYPKILVDKKILNEEDESLGSTLNAEMNHYTSNDEDKDYVDPSIIKLN